MAWTTADLLTSIKNRQMFPDASSGSLSPAALLQYATDELLIVIVPLISKMREKYYETYQDTAYSTATASLPIPSRAIGGAISVAQYLYGTDIRRLDVIDPSECVTQVASMTPCNIYFQNNSIIPYPPPLSTYGTIRLRYLQRPSRLEQTINCAQITAFNSGTGVVTCTPPSSWTTSNSFDFIPQTASQATPYNLNSVTTAISGTTMTFTLSAAQAALVNVGDWIALAEYTPIPEIPFELQAVLAQAACVRGLAAFGDADKLQQAKQDLKDYLQSAIDMMTTRESYGQKKVVAGWRRF